MECRSASSDGFNEVFSEADDDAAADGVSFDFVLTTGARNNVILI